MSSDSFPLSLSEQEFIRGGCAADCRGDGRTATEFRRYWISSSSSPIQLSHGSARLTDSGSALQMVCSVKAELVTPSVHQPNAGSIVVSVDQHGASTNTGARSQLRQHQVALQQRLQWVNDLSQLCVVPGAAAWRLHVDLFVVVAASGAGGGWPVDAASHCIRYALASTVLPYITVADKAAPTSETAAASSQPNKTSSSSNSSGVLDRLIVNSDIALAQPAVSLDSIPFLITVHLVPHNNNNINQQQRHVLILDATPEEQAVAVAAVHVAVIGKNSSSSNNKKSEKSVAAVWKSGAGSVPVHLLPTVVQTALDAVDTAQQSYQLVNNDNNNNNNNNRSHSVARQLLLQDTLQIQ